MHYLSTVSRSPLPWRGGSACGRDEGRSFSHVMKQIAAAPVGAAAGVLWAYALIYFFSPNFSSAAALMASTAPVMPTTEVFTQRS